MWEREKEIGEEGRTEREIEEAERKGTESCSNRKKTEPEENGEREGERERERERDRE